MPTFTIVATTVSQGSEEAELDTHVDDYDSEGEVIGYARRMAEEMFGMADQLQLDFDYSNISIYAGDHGDAEIDAGDASLIGMWFLADDGAGYASAQTLKEAAERAEEPEE